jgi:hypothetical protein
MPDLRLPAQLRLPSHSDSPRSHGDSEQARTRRLGNAASPPRGLPPFARRFAWGGRGVSLDSPLSPTTDARERRTTPASARDRPPLSNLRALPPWPAVVCRRRRLRASVSPWFNLDSGPGAGPRPRRLSTPSPSRCGDSGFWRARLWRAVSLVPERLGFTEPVHFSPAPEAGPRPPVPGQGSLSPLWAVFRINGGGQS